METLINLTKIWTLFAYISFWVANRYTIRDFKYAILLNLNENNFLS